MKPFCFLSGPTTALALALQFLAWTTVARAADPVWIIGGGPEVLHSQVQIERNVLWALESMGRLPGARDVKVFFTDGEDPGPDIHEWTLPQQDPAALQPLADVFDNYWSNGLSYRSHRIPEVAGTTEADALVSALDREFRTLKPDANSWLLFIGHGTYSGDLDNGLELWNQTRLRVSDLQNLLDLAPPQTHLRFVFTQCYSGAFAKLATAGTRRCGFLADAADRESEGCSAAIEKRDYEDYSTYFFAALTGQPRNHAGLGGIPDRNADGIVTPLEAHFHVLATAYSADIPRSTSEVLLMQWQPWYLPLVLSIEPEPENEYRAMARELMARVAIDPAGDPATEIERRLLQLDEEQKRLASEQEELRVKIQALQAEVARPVLIRWPEAGAPYTAGFVRFLAEDLTEALALIEAQPGYSRLTHQRDELWQRLDQMLDLERRKTRLEKIDHLLQLARVLAILEGIGPKEVVERYRALRECESAPF